MDGLFGKVNYSAEQTFCKFEVHLHNDIHIKNLVLSLQHEQSYWDPITAGGKRLFQHLNTLRVEAQPAAVIFIGSPREGYVVRSDIISYRLQHIRTIQSIYDITAPCARLSAMLRAQKSDIIRGDMTSLLSSTLSVIIIQETDENNLKSRLDQLSEELFNKLSISLTITEPCSAKTVCVIGGGFSPGFRNDMFNAAAASGLRLVIIDKPGHWMESWADAREMFVSVDMSIDEGLCDRLVTACRKCELRLDGITTYSDRYRVATAQVAQILGLPTDSPDMLDICTRKDRFRHLFPIDDCPSFCVTSMQDFHAIANDLASHLPLIVKPRSGGNSTGVNKAESIPEAELLVEGVIHSGSAALLEKYIDGPEVDVNIALVDGDIVFYDINDAPPCSAESNGCKSEPASFIEDRLIWPSILPSSEQSILFQTALESVKKLGLTHGIFHLEGRIVGSSMVWTRGNSTRLPRLEIREAQPGEQPRTMLIEINPRPPGYPGQPAISACYGIDYALLQLLLCIGDTCRARILSLPFEDLNNTCVITQFVLTPRAGIFRGENMFEELRDKLPHLMENVVEKILFFKDGDVVKDPSQRASWVTFFIVKSDNGREDALRICEEIKSNLKWEIS